MFNFLFSLSCWKHLYKVNTDSYGMTNWTFLFFKLILKIILNHLCNLPNQREILKLIINSFTIHFYTLFCFRSIIKITGIPKTELITFKGICDFSATTEKNNIINIPKNIFNIHCCQSFAGL